MSPYRRKKYSIMTLVYPGQFVKNEASLTISVISRIVGWGHRRRVFVCFGCICLWQLFVVSCRVSVVGCRWLLFVPGCRVSDVRCWLLFVAKFSILYVRLALSINQWVCFQKTFCSFFFKFQGILSAFCVQLVCYSTPCVRAFLFCGRELLYLLSFALSAFLLSDFFLYLI